MSEVWKDIVGYEGYYQVSNRGRVRSLGFLINNRGGSTRYKPGRIRKLSNHSNGYKFVKLFNAEQCYIHRLVLSTFRPLDNMDALEVNHKDGDKTNNNLDNLEWVTHRENQQHSYDTGLHVKGENHPQAKLADKEVMYIRQNYIPCHPTFGGKALAKRFGISRAQVSRVVHHSRRKEVEKCADK